MAVTFVLLPFYKCYTFGRQLLVCGVKVGYESIVLIMYIHSITITTSPSNLSSLEVKGTGFASIHVMSDGWILHTVDEETTCILHT